jgi:hypothetical protein
MLILTAIGTCHWNFPIALDIINDAFPTSILRVLINTSLINCTGVVGLNVAYTFPIYTSIRNAIFLRYIRLANRIEAQGRHIECAQMDCTCSVIAHPSFVILSHTHMPGP